MPETTYTIEFAKSGRSKCKKCKVQIEKSEIRLGVLVAGGDFDIQSWYHPACFNLPRKLATGANKMTPDEFVENLLEDSTGGEILPDKHDEIVEAIASKPEPKAAKTEGGGGGTGSGLMKEFNIVYKEMEKENKKKKRKKDDDDDENDDPQPKNKKFKGSKEEQAMFEIYGKYYKNNIDQIKDILRFNRQVLTGTKDFLMYKLIDGEINGRLARCTLCGGRLKFQDETCTKVICGGTFDEDTQMRVDCAFTAKTKDAPRWKPWFTEEPTEEEKEKMDKLEAEAQGDEGAADDGGSGGGDLEEKVGEDLVKKIKDMEWDLSDKDARKQTVRSFVKILAESQKGKKSKRIDLPQEEGEPKSTDQSAIRMEVGRCIMENRDASAMDILKHVVKNYGLLDAKAAKQKKKENALEAACNNPKNAPILAAFQELSELYFKEGNRNAGVSYKKVVSAIKDMDLEITASNALGFCKGKTKVAGIGKGSAEKMHEFCTTGTIAKLEEKRG